MAALNSLNRNMLRLTGMSSGMDTTSIVESLIQLDQQKVDKQFKAKTKIEWKGDAYRDFNTKLRQFREKYMSVLSPDSNVFSASAYNAFQVTLLDEKHSKYVSISAGSNASATSLNIKEITQLAESARLTSNNVWGTGNSQVVSLDTKLVDAPFARGINWEPARLTGNKVRNEDYEDELEALIDAGYEVATDADLAAAGITREEGKTYHINRSNGDDIQVLEEMEDEYARHFSFTINGETFEFNDKNTLNEMVSAVNRKSAETGVTMSYSSITKSFALTTRATGEESEITVANGTYTDPTDPNATLQFNVFGANSFLGITSTTDKGQNAKLVYEVNGQNYTVEQKSNSFTMDGISYTLKQTYDSSALQEAGIQFNVERDIQPVFDKIMGFINGYNALIEEMQSAITQKPNKDYDPLTDDERGQLSETEATKWEGLAKEGLLYRDSNISNLLSTMRGAFYDVVEGVGRSAANIGLRTTAYDYTSGGKITVDEEALKSALANNPEQVKDIFTKVGTNADGSANYSESGLIVRISNAMNSYVKTINEVTLNTNSTQLSRAEDKLEDLQEWLLDRENGYWKKFSAMETALASLNSQTSSISSLLSSMG